MAFWCLDLARWNGCRGGGGTGAGTVPYHGIATFTALLEGHTRSDFWTTVLQPHCSALRHAAACCTLIPRTELPLARPCLESACSRVQSACRRLSWDTVSCTAHARAGLQLLQAGCFGHSSTYFLLTTMQMLHTAHDGILDMLCCGATPAVQQPQSSL